MDNNIRYKQMEQYMTYALFADAVLFILFLIFAGLGIIWLKVITAILCILLSGACLALLYLSKELLKQRSLWMSTAAYETGPEAEWNFRAVVYRGCCWTMRRFP